MRERGYSRVRALCLGLPAAFALRGWRKFAQWVNGRMLGRWVTARRLSRFQDRLAPRSGRPRFFVIVMPNTLHFLLPCLALLRGHAQVVLLANGAAAWEVRRLRASNPELPVFRLATLPGSSVAHGDVVSLLIEHHRGDFGIVDHDCYVFDDSIWARLELAPGECMAALYGARSPAAGIRYPQTHFLFLNAESLRRLSHRYGVDARLYRRTPAAAREAMERLRLRPGLFFKEYQSFHDTLHVLLALALAEGMRVRFLETGDDRASVHVGGTSLGSHHTKRPFALYTHLCFMELADDAEISRRYAHLTFPLKSAKEALARRRPDDRDWDALDVLDTLIARLRRALEVGDGAAARRATSSSSVGSP
jgi:hypothetical protein